MPPRASKRKSVSSSSSPASGATVEVESDKRSYNSQEYWDQRYQRHLADDKPTAAAATTNTAAASPAADSDDITAEWYYSFADLAHILLPALRGVDRTKAVLDIGCGVSTFFEQLQAPMKEGADESEDDEKEESGDGTADVGGAGFTGECIGLDYSPTVVSHLRDRFPSSNHPHLHWICGDACHLLPDVDAAVEKPRGKAKKARKSAGASTDEAASSSAPPPLTPAEQALFAPESFSLILDKATSDGMLCSDHTAVLTPLIYANVARLLAPNGLFVIASVNGPESGWFGEYVVSQLIEHGGDCQWQIEVHSPSSYTDGEEGAPNVYVIRKHVNAASTGRAVRASTASQREPYTIKHHTY